MNKNHKRVMSGVELCWEAEDWALARSDILHMRALIQSRWSMRDAPPDYLKTISTIEPLGSHRLLFTIQKKRTQIFDR